MPVSKNSDLTQTLNEEGRELWNQKATFWDALPGDEGNSFHRRLVAPTVERRLALQPGERVLDVACGNGVMSRQELWETREGRSGSTVWVRSSGVTTWPQTGQILSRATRQRRLYWSACASTTTSQTGRAVVQPLSSLANQPAMQQVSLAVGQKAAVGPGAAVAAVRGLAGTLRQRTEKDGQFTPVASPIILAPGVGGFGRWPAGRWRR
jgi:hypothetical protein